VSARIVAIKCPSCKGSGKFMGASFACLWCKGAKKLRRDDALRYANQSVTLAVGGYITGDLDWKERGEMLADADAITSTFGVSKFCPEAAR
jgi:hypothetical protein